MRGEILSFDNASGVGLISGDDGARYEFAREAVTPPTGIGPGQRVDFVPQDSRAVQVMLLASAAPTAAYGGSGMVGGEQPIDWGTLFFSFQGRARRMHFGIAWLIIFGISILLGWIPILGILISIGLLWPNLAITVKRLHDMGKSGWFAAIPFGIGIIGGLISGMIAGAAAMANARALENEDPAAIMAVMGPAVGVIAVVALVGLGFLLWLVLTPSQPGANQYGPNPKGM